MSCDLVNFIGIMGHEFTAMVNCISCVVSRPACRKRHVFEEFATAAPEKSIAQSVQFQIHGPVSLSPAHHLHSFVMVLVAERDGDVVWDYFIPEGHENLHICFLVRQ